MQKSIKKLKMQSKVSHSMVLLKAGSEPFSKLSRPVHSCNNLIAAAFQLSWFPTWACQTSFIVLQQHVQRSFESMFFV